MGSKYIVRQPIKDAAGEILGYEILYHGENQAFIGDAGAANEFAAADTIYNFLTQNSTKSLKGSLNFMTFTTMLLMKKTPRLFDKSELVIQIDDSVIIHPLSMHFVNQYAREGYKIAANEFQFAPRYLTLLDSLDYIKLNSKTTTDAAMHNIIDIAHSMHKKCIVTNIETEEQYQKAVALGADAMEEPMSQRS
ncbi:MAG: EAL domain-containing protein [Neglectibacter sp.]